MRNKKIILISIILIFIFVGIVAATSGKHKIKFYNQSNQTVTYSMYQIDHKLDYPKPLAFVMGTLEPNEEWIVSREPGLYYVEWKSLADEVLLKIDPFQLNKDVIFIFGNSIPPVKA